MLVAPVDVVGGWKNLRDEVVVEGESPFWNPD